MNESFDEPIQKTFKVKKKKAKKLERGKKVNVHEKGDAHNEIDWLLGCLVAWLLGCLVTCLVAWLLACLVACLVACLLAFCLKASF